MASLIQLIIYVILFAIVAFGMHWVCVEYALPRPVLWICGALLLIVLLVFLGDQLGTTTKVFPRLK